MEKENDLLISVDILDNLKLPLRIDDIRHYGLKAQTSLESFSRFLAKAYLSARNDSTEALLFDAVSKLESHDNRSDFGISRASAKTKRYRILLQTIDELKLAFQMEQVSLTKEIQLYNRAKAQILTCCDELELYLKQGEQHLINISQGQICTDEQSEFVIVFRRKLDELQTSKTIAEQGRVQLELMNQNAVALESKIREAILNTIPLWRNQVSLLFGIDKIKEKTKTFERLRKSTNKNNHIVVTQEELNAIDDDLKEA